MKRSDNFGATDADGYKAHLGVEELFENRNVDIKNHTPEAIKEDMKEEIENSEIIEEIELREHKWLFSEDQVIELVKQAADLEQFRELFTEILDRAESP